ncbi:unnamed protein product [Lactuca virosa]|uniref:Uncharacterized protein n=1 Tax=Lactuca virosa TaxID=75947 RepID=A0AAU9P4T9_9ASTR|nr:unnamed protein product [Lactuca virosa]
MFERSYSSSCFNYFLFHRLFLTCSTAVYKKDYELITFQMETKGKKNLTKEQFTQILKLESDGPFETLAPNQVFSMLNEIGKCDILELMLIEAYQQEGIQVPEGEEVAVFSHLQIPKSLVDDPKAFPVIGRIAENVLELVPLSNPVLIRFHEMFADVPRKKRKATGVLNMMASKKQVTKPMKKKKTIEVTVLGTPDYDESTYTEDMDLSKGQYSQSHRDANADDVNHLIHDAFHHDTPPVSP